MTDNLKSAWNGAVSRPVMTTGVVTLFMCAAAVPVIVASAAFSTEETFGTIGSSHGEVATIDFSLSSPNNEFVAPIIGLVPGSSTTKVFDVSVSGLDDLAGARMTLDHEGSLLTTGPRTSSSGMHVKLEYCSDPDSSWCASTPSVVFDSVFDCPTGTIDDCVNDIEMLGFPASPGDTRRYRITYSMGVDSGTEYAGVTDQFVWHFDARSREGRDFK